MDTVPLLGGIGPMRIIALVAAFNEGRMIAGCIEHLREQGVEVYLIDNDSTDGTAEIAERYLGHGVVDIERRTRTGYWEWHALLRRKAELAASLDGDWFMHLDPDERHHPPDPQRTLAEVFGEVEAQGFNAVNFLEFTFVPTIESPDHDHPDYARTMRWYYPFMGEYPHRLNAWKRQEQTVELAASDGHRVAFAGMRIAPRILCMRHYLFLSPDHALTKYSAHRRPDGETADPHNWRAEFHPGLVKLPSEQELRFWVPGGPLDRAQPERWHVAIAKRERAQTGPGPPLELSQAQ